MSEVTFIRRAHESGFRDVLQRTDRIQVPLPALPRDPVKIETQEALLLMGLGGAVVSMLWIAGLFVWF